MSIGCTAPETAVLDDPRSLLTPGFAIVPFQDPCEIEWLAKA